MLTENTYVDRIEALIPSLAVQVRVSNEVLRDGEIVAQSFSRYVLEPGADLTGQPEIVAKICAAVWT